MKQKNLTRLNQAGFHHAFIIAIAFVILFGAIGTYFFLIGHATTQCTSGGSYMREKIANQAYYDRCLWNGGRNWQGSLVSHATLLSLFTDGNAGEFWCADFISYVYKTAGYPFHARTGYYSRDGWDWPNAWSMVNLPGFTYHKASGYSPKRGDIAEFDYPGGHVELVVHLNPTTFIYGDTASGGMGYDTYNNGHVVGYVSPN
jgi:hypothetical protein